VIDADPLNGRAADPIEGAMLTLVALLLVQVRVAATPPAIVDGAAVRVTDGGGGADTFTVAAEVALPPAPVAVIL
jgi:hypothetical protein